MKSQLAIVFLGTALVLVNAQSIDDCLKQDSISCVQRSLYRKAKEFFDKDSFEIVNGVSLVKAVKNGDGNARSGKAIVYDNQIDAAADVAERQSILENFVGDEAGEFLSGRSLRINFAPAITKIGESARAMVDSVPEEVKQAVNEVAEGRGKKKLLKTILPLLIAAKLKIGALATLAFFAIGLMAKKAIFASLISIAISAFIGLKSLWDRRGAGHDITAYNSPGWTSASAGSWSGGAAANSGWSSGGNNGWEDPHSGQNQAYSGYHY